MDKMHTIEDLEIQLILLCFLKNLSNQKPNLKEFMKNLKKMEKIIYLLQIP